MTLQEYDDALNVAVDNYVEEMRQSTANFKAENERIAALAKDLPDRPKAAILQASQVRLGTLAAGI